MKIEDWLREWYRRFIWSRGDDQYAAAHWLGTHVGIAAILLLLIVLRGCRGI